MKKIGIGLLVAGIAFGAIVTTNVEAATTSFKLDERAKTKNGESKTPKNKYAQLSIITGNVDKSPKSFIGDKAANEIQDYFWTNGGTQDKWKAVKQAPIPVFEATPDTKPKDIQIKTTFGSSAVFNAKKVTVAIEQINTQVQAIKPTEDGVDYVEALTDANDEQKGLFVVIGSGLNDSGDLNFAENDYLSMSDAQIDELIATVAKNVNTKFTGDTILFQGLGVTTKGQETLDNKQKQTVRNIYTKLFTKLGAKVIIDKNTSQYGSNPKAVSTKYSVNMTVLDKPIKFSSTDIKFKADSAELVDEAAAKKQLTGVAKVLKNSDVWKAEVMGTEAVAQGGTQTTTSELTTDRANVIKELLVSMGVSADKLTAKGVGSTFEGYKKETVGGKWSESIAKKNRQVIIKFVK